MCGILPPAPTLLFQGVTKSNLLSSKRKDGQKPVFTLTQLIPFQYKYTFMKKFLLSTLLLSAACLLHAQTSTLFATGLDQPSGLAFDGSGNLFVSNTYSNTVSKVDAGGAVTGTYTGFTNPIGLAFDGAGNLYVSNIGANTVSKVNPSGTIIATYTGFTYPAGLAVDASGYLYVANELGNNVNKLDAGGNIVATYTGFNQPVSLAVDGSGNLFVSNYLGNMQALI